MHLFNLTVFILFGIVLRKSKFVNMEKSKSQAWDEEGKKTGIERRFVQWKLMRERVNVDEDRLDWH